MPFVFGYKMKILNTMVHSASWKSSLLEKVILPAADLITRQRVMASYRIFREAQWWPLERLLEIQNSRLRETLQTAYYHVPFYREHFDRHGIRVEEITRRTDLDRIPPVTKDDLSGSISQPLCEKYALSSS